MQNYGWVLTLVPAAVLLVLLPLRPKRARPVLDLGGLALSEVLKRLDQLITSLENAPAGQVDRRSLDTVVDMSRSALAAYMQSVQWRKDTGVPPDPLVNRSLNENLLDALRLVEVGTHHWLQLRAELQLFYDCVSRQPVGDGASGGSTPPTPTATA